MRDKYTARIARHSHAPPGGERDTMIPRASTDWMAELFRDAGAIVDVQWQSGPGTGSWRVQLNARFEDP